MLERRRTSFAEAGADYVRQREQFDHWVKGLIEFVGTRTINSLAVIGAEGSDIRLTYLGRNFVIRHSYAFDGNGRGFSRLTSYHVDDLVQPGPIWRRGSVLILDRHGNIGPEGAQSWNLRDAEDGE